MNITIDPYNSNQSIDKSTTSHSTVRVCETNRTGGYALDISGIVTDNTAYGGQGKTAEDVMQEAGQAKDTLALQKDYMAVMSNSVSEEDLARIQKEGFHPGSEDIETVVTIVDKIKASLAEAGVNIIGYTDDLDVETLAKAVGSKGLAHAIVDAFAQKDIPLTEANITDTVQAYQKADTITSFNDGAIKYMVQNHLSPTIENAYKAQFSDTTSGDRQGRGYYADDAKGYYAKKADNFNWEQLRPQMEKIIEEAGFAVDETSIANAKWLVEKGVPLTAEALTSLSEMKNIELPRDMKWIVNSMAAAIADGKSAKDALLTDNRSLDEQAVDIKNALDAIPEEAVDIAVAEGKKLNLRNLSAIRLRIEESVEIVEVSVNITARRQLAEARLMMTVQANKQLLRNGFSLDTMEMEELVEALKHAEENQNMAFTNSPDAVTAQTRMDCYTSTLQILQDMPSMPAAVLGRAALQTETRVTLTYVHAEGTILKNAYESAGQSYEALMTAPRRDLGDSIQKAFANVDAILEDFHMELSAENQRAVRILGYNSMEITAETIAAVKEADKELTSVVKKLTPSAVLRMIRDGENPLDMTIKELDDYLFSQEDTPEKEAEDYRKFLVKLEKNADITEAEKESYIGIYRLVRQIEKTDGAVLGSLVHQGAELSFKNLLSAVRTNKNKGIDAAIDDSFGGLEALHSKGVSISEQIEAAYKALEQADSKQAEETFIKEELQNMQEAGTVSDDVIEQILDGRQPVTVDNLLAADYLMHYRGRSFKKIFEYAENNAATKKENISEKGNSFAMKEAVKQLENAFTDKESAVSAYEHLQETVTDVLETAEESIVTAEDMKSVVMLHKQISLATKFAREENYEVPVYINGEMTSINLKLLHNTGESKVTASMFTEEIGNIAAEFALAGEDVQGYVVCNRMESLAVLQQLKEQLEAGFSQIGCQTKELYVVQSKELNMQTFNKMGKNADKQNTEETQAEQTAAPRQLYSIAKVFIASVQSIRKDD